MRTTKTLLAGAQADLSLRRAHMSEGTLRLIYTKTFIVGGPCQYTHSDVTAQRRNNIALTSPRRHVRRRDVVTTSLPALRRQGDVGVTLLRCCVLAGIQFGLLCVLYMY